MPTSRPKSDDVTPGASLTAAATFLRELPEPWAPWPGTAWALAPALRDTAHARGWTLGPALRDFLTAWPDDVRSYEAVLAARIRRLPTRTRAAAFTTTTARSTRSTRSTDTSASRCARCGAAGSVVHASARWPRPVCIRCATSAAGPPAADPASHAAAARAALRYGRRITSP
ncbi:hypothetical protein [Streptomyces sp. NBC_01439]|uniref:hypothetical protein n=1 Tax=Streptomyces sp. NBC_01439 TaxID=2903867 RepID=UPI002E29E1F6|nr:hypothetical protein [Streptomyces sp. NBC_01439]